MKNTKGYNVFDTFIFRTPLFSIDKLKGETNWLNDSGIINNSAFLESIFIASPELYQEIERFKSGKLKQDDILNIQLSLLKYYIRMCSRCTPFGLFAGCGAGTIGEKNEIILSITEKYKSFTRLDMNYLCSLIDKIASYKHVQKQIKYFPNTSLYESGRNYRYIEYKYFSNHRKHFLTSLQKDLYLELVLQKAVSGVLIDDLINSLVCEDISFEDAEEYILDLINSQVLVSELEPSVCGENLLIKVINKLEGIGQTNELVTQLKEVDSLVNTIDNNPIGRPVSMYRSVYDALQKFNIAIDTKYLFQSDLYISNAKATINENTVSMVLETIGVLNKLTPKYENLHLKNFKEEFSKRYDKEEISLVDALDADTGIGFADKGILSGDINPLLDDIMIFLEADNGQNITISSINTYIQKKYEDFITAPQNKIIFLTEEELSKFPVTWDDLPNTIGTMIELIKEESKLPTINLLSMGGSSAANLLSRFCHINDDIAELVKNITHKEKELDSSKILAEIVHLPESRVGNILFRPTNREFEITYLANHSVKSENVINVNDIMVSIRGKKIVLRSKKFNKEIVPRLSTAHDFSNNSLPIYHFLCLLQTQDLRSSLMFSWGPILNKKEYLPRVMYKNVVLSPATWNITPSDIKKVPKITNENFITEVERFRKKKNIPNKALLVHKDNKLLIDFNNILSVKLLFDETNQLGFRLEEFLFTDMETFVTRDKETFTNQLILCFYKTDEKL